MTELELFKNQVEKYLKSQKVTATRFGLEFAGDPNFVFNLRLGREPRFQTREKIFAAMEKKNCGASAA